MRIRVAVASVAAAIAGIAVATVVWSVRSPYLDPIDTGATTSPRSTETSGNGAGTPAPTTNFTGGRPPSAGGPVATRVRALVGRVTDEAGNGLRDARVRIAPNAGLARRQAPAGRAFLNACVATATTDGEGRFRANWDEPHTAGPPPPEWLVVATHPHQVGHATKVVATSSRSAGEMVLAGEPGGALRVRLISRNEHPNAHVAVSVVSLDAPRTFPFVGMLRDQRLVGSRKPGAYEVRVVPLFAPLTPMRRVAHVTAGATTDVELALAQAELLRGVVVGTDGVAMSNVDVRATLRWQVPNHGVSPPLHIGSRLLHRGGPRAPADGVSAVVDSGGVEVRCRTGADGRFELGPLLDGTAMLTAVAGETEHDPVMVDSSQLPLRIVMPSQPPLLRVVLPPAERSTWTVHIGNSHGPVAMRPGVKGVVPIGGMSSGPHLVVALSENRKPPAGFIQVVEVESGSSLDLPVEPRATGRLRFTAQTAGGIAVGDPEPHLRKDGLVVRLLLDSTGSARRVSIPAGVSFDFFLRDGGSGGLSRSRAVRVEPGQELDLGVIALEKRE